MPVGTYSPDVLTRIVNVHWGGGEFIYGTLLDNALYYVKIKDAASDPEQSTIVPPGPGDPNLGLSAYGSSYNLIVKNEGLPNETRTPTFLICGNRVELVAVDDGAGNEIHLPRYFTLIYYSNDGLNWRIALEHASSVPSLELPSGGTNPVALVWDKNNNAFFYDQNDAAAANEQIFRSSDGASWTQVSSTSTEDADPDTYKSAFLPHCATNDCIDEKGQHVPDGVMSIPGDKTAKPVKPPIINYALGTSSVGIAYGDPLETWGSAEIQISVKTIESDGKPVTSTKTISVTGVKKVFCVAIADGILMAGGAADIAGETGAVALSFDMGATWKTIANRASPVTTMVAGAG
jgi:hypothetical protein